MSDTGSIATQLHCAACGKVFPLNSIQTLCVCGGPILVDYDLASAAGRFHLGHFTERPPDMWRYRELLPVQNDSHIVSLGEGGTPLLPSQFVGPDLGLKQVWLKDETVNPTGSFKARGLGMAVSRARELGIERLIIPTAGNAGSAVAAYASRAGMECMVVMPRDVPAPFQVDCVFHGARIDLVDGTIADCGKRVAQLVESEGWFSVATLKEPYRIEGKKTMGFELAEQFECNLPEVIIYPTGGGTGLIGMWKAFDELELLGWIDERRPKMISVQAEGCAPIPRAFDQGAERAEPWSNPHTVAAGLRVPAAVGDFLMLRAVRDSAGLALAVSDDDIMKGTRRLAEGEGIFSSPEGGAAVACLEQLVRRGQVGPDDRVVLFITGSGYKYLDVLKEYMDRSSGRSRT